MNRRLSFFTQVEEELSFLDEAYSLGRPPSVTIAILTRDSPDLIRQCCDSILEQVKYPGTTLLIADTGTTDPRVWSYYLELETRCAEKALGFRLHRMNYYHFGRNYNEVVAAITSDFVLIQNNDTMAINDYVTGMMSVAVLRKVGSVGCRMLYQDGRIQHDGQLIYHGPGDTLSEPTHVHLGMTPDELPAGENRIAMVDGNTGAAILMRRSAFMALGGFDAGYRDVYQDVDLMMKITQVLRKPNYCNRHALSVHMDNASRLGHGMDSTRMAHMAADRGYLYSKARKNGWVRSRPPEAATVSLISWVQSIDVYRTCLDALLDEPPSAPVELIAIPGFFPVGTREAAIASACEIANGKPVTLDDNATLTPGWLESLTRSASLET